MLKVDHLTVIAPTLFEGVLHVQNCLDLEVLSGHATNTWAPTITGFSLETLCIWRS